MDIRNDSQSFTPPSASTASRLPPLRSRGSSRGTICNIKTNRTICYESAVERRAAYVFMARSDVADIWDQPPPVTFVGADGKPHHHTFDFLVLMRDGSRTAVAVKPYEKADRISDTLERIAKQGAAAHMADRITLVTERDLPIWKVWNAEFIHSAMRERADGDDTLLREILTKIAGSVTIRDIVRLSGLSGRGFRAVARLLANGELILVHPGRIKPQSLVTKASSGAQAKGGR